MDKFVDKFNVYDLFSMLIPGIGICTLLGVTLSFKYYEIWENYGTAKYAVFFIFSYFCGVIFHELGEIADKCLHKIIYGGKPREVCFMDPKRKKRWQFFRVIIIDDDYFFNNVKILHKYIFDNFVTQLDNDSATDGKDVFKSKNVSTNNINNSYNRNSKHLNTLVFGYCLNIAENNNIVGKYKYFNVISELSRSLFLGCFISIIINIIMFIVDSCHYTYYISNLLIIMFLAYVFIHRKIRYERYQIRILLREIYLFFKSNNAI